MEYDEKLQSEEKRKRICIQNAVKQGREMLLDLVFPRRCPVCGEIVIPKGEFICPSCVKKLSPVHQPVCLKCGKELESDRMEFCYDCTRHHRSFERNLALLNYNDTASRSMSAIKYKNKREYLDFYSEALWLRFGRQIHFWNPDLFVPVPIHPTRRKIRGFNQAEVLAEKLSEKSGIPVCGGALKRIRKTAPQKMLDSSARFHNLEQAFGPGSIPQGTKRVLLVDDIYTTGSTMKACTRILLKMGVEQVYGLTVCIGKN